MIRTDRLFAKPRLSVLAMAALACCGAVAQEAPSAVNAPASAQVLDRVIVPGKRPIDVGPLPGLNVSKEEIPANLQSATKEEIKASRALNIGDFMNSQLQGVSVNDYAGNPFQLDVNYRGFTASPQIGTPQGLSVFFDGIRVNQPFGDVVNWDLMPLNAIERFDLFPGSNPVFGLNTLGGAISLRSKSGFTAPGLEGELMGGSWGRRQLKLSGGANDGTFGGFFAFTRFDEDGWRDNSPSRVQQFFGRGDWRGERGSLYGTVLLADNDLIGNGLIPLALYRERPQAVFTSPDQSRNRLTQVSIGGEFDLADKLTLTGQVYHRKSDRRGVNGDAYEGFDDFDAEHDYVVGPDGRAISRNGAYPQSGAEYNPFSPSRAGYVDGTPIGLVTRTELNQSTNGGALQFNWNLEQHKFLIGASIDRNETSYGMVQRLGLIDATHNVHSDPTGIFSDYVASQLDIPGNSFTGTTATKSLYVNETWTPVPKLTLTAAARYNHTVVDNDLLTRASEGQVDLHELRGFRDPGYTGAQAFNTTRTNESFTYTSFNPSVGANWRPAAGLNLFGNLSRGARTPSVVELGCAFDATPVLVQPALPELGTVPRSLVGPGCNLPTTLSGDPYLPQIRATSGELGFRQQLSKDWEWNASIYRTDLKNDIYYVGVADSKSYFDTIDKTRRQGLELGVKGKAGPVDLKASYSYTDATFQSTFYTVSPHNSSADFDQNSRYPNNVTLSGGVGLPTPDASLNRGFGTYQMIEVQPGARLPGIPAHAVNINLAVHPTPSWKVGLGMVARSQSYMRGNENNLHQPAGTDQEIGRYTCTAGGACQSTGYLQESVRPGRPFTEAGTVPGYALFNLDTSFEIYKGLSLFAQVTNLFDRETFSGGRLGVNPFSPSQQGAIGPSGWNYNSSEWHNSSFVAPGAPRGIFIGLTWELGAAQ